LNDSPLTEFNRLQPHVTSGTYGSSRPWIRDRLCITCDVAVKLASSAISTRHRISFPYLSTNTFKLAR